MKFHIILINLPLTYAVSNKNDDTVREQLAINEATACMVEHKLKT